VTSSFWQQETRSLRIAYIIGKEFGKKNSIFNGDEDQVAADEEGAEEGDPPVEEGEGEEDVEDEVGMKARVTDPRIAAATIDHPLLLVVQRDFHRRDVEGGEGRGGGEGREEETKREGQWRVAAREQHDIGKCGHKKANREDLS